MQENTNCHRTGGGNGENGEKCRKCGNGKDKPKPGKVKDVSLFSPKTDPQGMYTGVPKNPYDEPIQDADDL